MSLDKVMAIMRAEETLPRILAKLFTRPTEPGVVHAIHLDPQDPDCLTLHEIGLLDWGPGAGGWVFTEMGNAWLNQRKARDE